MSQQQKSKSKKDGAAKRGRNANPNGRAKTASNKRRRMVKEARKLEKKLIKLLRRGDITKGSARHKRLTACITKLKAGKGN